MPNKNASPLSITIDARLINNSGIGRYIKNLVPLVINHFHDLNFNILIDSKNCISYNNPSFHRSGVNLINCTSSLYTLYEQIETFKSIPKKTDLFWSPHYVTPIFYSKKMLVTIHDACHLALPEAFSGISKRIYAQLMYKVATSKAVKVITDSNFSKSELIKFTNVNPDIVEVIYLGVETTVRSTLAEPKKVNPSPYVVFLGNVKPNKNLVRLLKAFDSLIKTIPHRLLIIGKKDGFICNDPEVFSYAERLGERVEFTGFVSDEELKKILYNSEGLIFPSIYEGFGLPPLEAMACNCPVAASSAASIPEICVDAAIYFDPYSIDDMADKIYQLVTKPELSKSLVEKGAKRVETFSWIDCANKTCQIIENLLIAI
ncbi:MAG: glycosyltransferase family 4 protein [Thermosynechococcaceae cyanobacterium MS004]|nr:glycosyltransferase family 4 protein [Thermosynechococcaceae cyanobacterium MS004]